jgi:hypothetical protein
MLVNSGVQITVNNIAGSFVTGNPNDWAVTVLHELGHAYWDLYGSGTSKIQPDSASVSVSQANTALVQKKCKLN